MSHPRHACSPHPTRLRGAVHEPVAEAVVPEGARGVEELRMLVEELAVARIAGEGRTERIIVLRLSFLTIRVEPESDEGDGHAPAE